MRTCIVVKRRTGNSMPALNRVRILFPYVNSTQHQNISSSEIGLKVGMTKAMIRDFQLHDINEVVEILRLNSHKERSKLAHVTY